jgi:GNAT superfamily N-acetyltransferase
MRGLLMETILNTKYKIISGVNEIDFNKVTAMLKEAFWSMGIGINEVKQGATNSALVVGVFKSDGEQIGYARAISDKTRFAYILDVYVDERYRKQGIGRGMVEFIRRHPDLKDVYQWLLITRDAHGVYGKVGFKQLENADNWMEIRNQRPDR